MPGLTTTTDDGPLAERRRDRLMFSGLLAAAILAFFTLDYVGRPIVAAIAYWGCAAGAVAVLYRSDVIMDERDRSLERITSHRAVLTVGAALVVLSPGISALSAANVYEATPFVDGILFGWLALFVVWGLAHAVTNLQR
jgi:uncharacterized membrane protein